MEKVFILCTFLILPSFVAAQTWADGDNSTVEGCTNHCSVEAPNLQCWHSAAHFYEQTLVGHMRSYIAVLVGIDQWHRRHGLENGTDMVKEGEKKFEELKAHLQDVPEELLDDDVLMTVKRIAVRAQAVSNHVMPSIPHYQCPLPCEYTHEMYRSLFIASMILNGCLLVAVVPFIIKLMRQENEWAKEALIPSRR